MRAAAFLDRDGTIIEHVHHLNDPAQVRLIPGAAEAIRILQAFDYACVVITNQSVIGRGLLTVEGLERIHAEMHRQFAAHGVRLDGVFFCPIAPGVNNRSTMEHPDRKPGPGMLLRAAREMLLDISRSWMIGDMHSDMLAGRNARCRATILVKTGKGVDVADGDPSVDHVAASLLEAAQLIARTHLPSPMESERNSV